jgi:chlorobactene glucosyltransferase
MDWYWATHQLGLLAFLLLAVLIASVNALWLKKLTGKLDSGKSPRLSVFIPARNEEANLARCLTSLQAQDYPNYDLWVLDDHSNDKTAAIAAGLASGDERIHLIHGTDLPAGWLGKHWACHQLAQASQSELLLFTDADTAYHPQALSGAVALMVHGRYDLLSAVPLEEMKTFGEKLLVPYFLLGIFGFVPLFLASALRAPELAFSVGQFLLFRRTAYEKIGGYAAVRAEVADDVALGQRVLASGLRWTLADATDRVHCRMYHNFSEAWAGFSKNMFAGMGYRLIPYLFIWLWSGVIFLEPLGVLLLAGLGVRSPFFSPELAWLSLLLGGLLWAIPYLRLKLPVYMVLAYPLIFCLMFVLALRSLVLAFSGAASWKGRKLGRPKIRLI